MALDIDNPTHEHRSVGFVILGTLLVAIAGYLAYDLWYRADEPVAAATSGYTYTIQQSVDTNITYFASSFYGDKPGVADGAYVADLTDTVDATLHYRYHGSRSVSLSSMYSAVATVRELYATSADSTKPLSSVWSREYPFVKPITSTTSNRDITFSPHVTIPFADYRSMVDQFKNTLAVPVSSEVAITFTVRVYGTIDGTPLDDVRTSTVTMPLDQPLYTLATKFEKQDEKQIVPQNAKDDKVVQRMYERVAAAVLGLVGLAVIVYGLRKKIFKTAYQRELEKIYRYHDGIIIHAKRPSMVTDKNTIPVRSFDDILNIEEETKQPIIAYPLGDEATQFLIMKDDVMYTYTLGKELLNHDDSTLREANESVEEKKPKTKYRKVQ
jgi:hypothetical protein